MGRIIFKRFAIFFFNIRLLFFTANSFAVDCIKLYSITYEYKYLLFSSIYTFQNFVYIYNFFQFVCLVKHFYHFVTLYTYAFSFPFSPPCICLYCESYLPIDVYVFGWNINCNVSLSNVLQQNKDTYNKPSQKKHLPSKCR